MTDDAAISQLLTQLDGIANAPMTAAQRRARAQPLLDAAGLGVSDAAAATARADLPWSQRKAKEHGVPVETWLQAVDAAELAGSQSVTDLLVRIHRAEAAADLLKVGYTSARDASGRVTWSHEG